jgi:transcriptional regulator with XRE-family HTH domain
MTFGQRISEARKKAGLSQKDLAAKILKEDGKPISPQYLNDLEFDRRNPPGEHLMEQLAKVLKMPREVLYYAAGELPADAKGIKTDTEKVVKAYSAFRKALRGTSQ